MSIRELEAAGVKITRVRGGEVLGLCPFHDDTNPSFQANIHKRVFICFSCGAKGSFKELGIQGEPKVYRNAYSNLLKQDSNSIIDEVFSLPREFEPIHSKEGRFWEYLHGRKITYDTIQSFGIGCCKTGAYAGRIVIPMCTGFIARSIYSGRMGELIHGIPFRKYLFPLSLPTNRILYNFDPDSKTLILVEGVMDAIKLATYGVSATAVLTSKLSGHQCDLICEKSRAKKIFVCFDGDDAGESGADLAAEELSGFFGRSQIHIVRLPEGKDPGSMSEKLFFRYLDSAQTLSGRYSFLNLV